MKEILAQLPDYKTLRGKWDLLYFFLLPIGLMNLVVAIFLIDDHIAIHSITFSIVLALLVIHAIITKKLPNGIPDALLVIIIIGYVVFSIGAANSTGVTSDSIYLIRRWKIFVIYGLIFYFLPIQKKELYYTLFIVFMLMVCIFNFYTLYKYYDLIIVNQGKALPDASWINFMDLMKPYILPLDFYHHTLSLFNTLSLAFIYFLWKKMPQMKWIFVFSASFFVFMIHFYGSRTGIGVFYILVLVYSIVNFMNQKYAFLKICGLVLVAFLCVFGSYFLIPTLKLKADKLGEEFSFYANSSYEQILNGPDYRLPSYFKAFEIIKKSPIKGIGFEEIGLKFKNTSKPLNNYIYLILVLGIPVGLVLFISHFIHLFWIRNFKEFNLVIISFFVLHFMYSFSDAGLFYVDYFYFFSFWSVALVHIKIAIERQIPSFSLKL